MTDREFDEKIRAMLSEPQEEIPAGLWDRIAERLDDAPVPSERTAVLRKWFWGVSGAAAAVAILAFAGVRLLGPGQKTEAVAETEVFDIVKAPSKDESAVPLLAMSETPAASKPQRADVQESLKSGNKEIKEEHSPAMEVSADVKDTASVPEILVDMDKDGEPECEIHVDNSDIEAVYGTEEKSAKRKRIPFELTVGGNSFGGPQKGRTPKMMYSQGHRTPTYTFVEDSNSDRFDLPLSFGVGVKYSITKWLGIGVGVNYTLLGKKTSGTYYTEDGWSYSMDMKNTQHYIGIPVDVFFSVFRNRWWDTYATIGGCVEKCISCKYTGFHEGTQLSYSPKVNGVQTSVKVGLGVEFSPLSFMGIYIDPSLRYYFDNGQPRSIRTAQPLAFGVEAGLRFRL